MQVSAEIRWFWHNQPPPGLKHWFLEARHHPCSAGGGGGPRRDRYFHDPHQDELGLKLRGSKKGVEIKGLITLTRNGLTVDPFVGPIEIWAKWTSEPLNLPEQALFKTKKLRWLRKFDTTKRGPEEIPLDSDEKPSNGRALPMLGCNVELTQVTLSNEEVWWTLGFEAFGNIRTVENDLRATASILAERHPPEFEQGMVASYPSWLKNNAAP